MARLAANATGVPETTIRSALRRTKSVASSGTRSDFSSANRYSMVIFCPSIHPSLRELFAERVHEDRADRKQLLASRESYAEDFLRLLRLEPSAPHSGERDDDCKNPRHILVCGTAFGNFDGDYPERSRRTQSRFSILDYGIENRRIESGMVSSCIFPLIQNRKSKIQNLVNASCSCRDHR